MARILVVDDEEPILRLLKTVFVDAGHDVQVARGATEAIEQCRRFECFDVILSDVVMPGMDGHRLACQIASLCPRSRVILMSGFDPGCEICPYTKGCPRVSKPFRLEQVLGVISEALASLPPEHKPQ